MIGDVLGVELENYKGQVIKNDLVTAMNENTLNTVQANFTDTNYTVVDVAAAFLKASGVLVQLLLLLTGTYIFHILWFLLGADTGATLVVGGMMVLYAIMLGNTIIAKIRGI